MDTLTLLWPLVGPAVPILAMVAANYSKPVRRVLFASIYRHVLADIQHDVDAMTERIKMLTADRAATALRADMAENQRDHAQGQVVVLQEQNQLLRDSIAMLRHEAAQRDTEIALLRGLLKRYAPHLSTPATLPDGGTAV